MLWGRLPCAADDPVLTVEPGTEVTFDTVSHEGILEDQGRDPKAFFGQYDVVGGARRRHRDRGRATCRTRSASTARTSSAGRSRVAGARPGDLLAMTVVETLPRVPYGVISNRHGKGALPGEYPREGERLQRVRERRRDRHPRPAAAAAGGEPAVEFPLAPFLGIMGVAVAGDARPHSVPPGAHGGNIDINLLTVGVDALPPVQVEGALAYVGDPHFAQGDGEVSLTAMEASLRATVRLDVVPHEDAVRRFGELAGPLAETTDHLVPTGMDEDLDVAVQNCVRAAIALLESRYGMDPRAGLRLPVGRHRLQHLPGRRRREGRARAHPQGRLRHDRPMTQAPVPAGLVEAFWEYERALMSDDVPTLDRLFAPGPTTLRGDANGLLVGHDQISAFRSGRGGAPQRRIVQTHVQTVDDDHALVVAVTELERGGRGQQTQLWVRTADGWKVTAAHVSVPGAGGRHPDLARWSATRSCRRSAAARSTARASPSRTCTPCRASAIGAGNPAWLAEARVEPVHARAVELLLEAGASVRGIARTDEFAYSLAGTNAHYGTPPNPKAPLRISGGSTSGSSSAVSLGHATIGLGTDTGGSIRVPAAYQGLYGIRTTHGVASTYACSRSPAPSTPSAG